MSTNIPDNQGNGEYLVGYKRPPVHSRFTSSGNPHGRPKGTPSIPHIIARLLAMSAADWQCFEPENAAEIIALQAIKDAARSTFIDPAAVKSREFIVDRLHGKAIQRRVDLSEDDTISRAKMGFALLNRCAEKIMAQHGIEISKGEIIADVLAGIESQYHEAVIRELSNE